MASGESVVVFQTGSTFIFKAFVSFTEDAVLQFLPGSTGSITEGFVLKTTTTATVVIGGILQGAGTLHTKTGRVQANNGILRLKTVLGEVLNNIGRTTTTSTLEACNSTVGSGSVDVTTGGAINYDTTCVGGTVTADGMSYVTSSRTDTAATTSTTFGSGSTFMATVAIDQVPNMVYFNGPLTLQTGSQVVVTMVNTTSARRADAVTAYDIARFQGDCDQEVTSTVNGASGYTVATVAETANNGWCNLRVMKVVEAAGDDSNTSLYGLFALLLLPVIGCCLFMMLRKPKTEQIVLLTEPVTPEEYAIMPTPNSYPVAVCDYPEEVPELLTYAPTYPSDEVVIGHP